MTAPPDRAPPPSDAPAGTSAESLGCWLESMTVDTLRPLLGLSAILIAGFVVYNAIDLPAHARAPVLVHDVASSLMAGIAWWLCQRGKLPSRFAHLGGALLALVIASNVLLVMLLIDDPSYVFYMDVILIGVGAGMTLRGWAVGTTLALWLVAAPGLWFAASDATVFGRHLATMVAATALAAGIFEARMRNLRRIFALLGRDRAHQAALERSLEDLDRKVEDRTKELLEANEALRQQIEERERAEKEAAILTDQLRHAQRLESIGQLAGGVAHDFNNLLTVITSNLHVSMTELDADHDKEPLEDALLATERASNLTRQLLAFSRKQEMEPRTLDLFARIEGMDRMLRRLVGEDVRLVTAAPSCPVWVDADPTHIEQILMNLVANARDAMPEGGTLCIRVDTVDDERGSCARLTVSDDGIGMEPALRDRIFEPFFTTKEVGRGTGLGLSTVYGIVKQHHGDITVASQRGEGTTFTILLPLSDAKPASARPTTAIAPTGTGETILVVEDEPAVRRIAERMLSRLGYRVLVAGSGDEALAIAGALSAPIDLLFTDVVMPGMNGAEVARALSERQPGLEVLFVSGYAGDYLKSKTGEPLAEPELLYKPYVCDELASRVRELLDRRACA